MKVVGIGAQKGRCYEYLPIMTVSRDEATELLHDLNFSTLEIDDAYAIRELENLAEKAKEGFVIETKKHEFNVPQMSSQDLENIVQSLEEMRSTLSSRISIID
jgi:galactose-1-phosphate uridylyltransferase